MPELKGNIWNLGNRIDFKCEGRLAYSFDKFYVVMKFVLKTMEDLKFYQSNFIQHVIIWMLM